MIEHDLDEFAGFLRQLKERTGRSYEALAKRTGISSSAVHRYCSGKSLPPDFETAARIAKACGATSDELLELHKRWLRAESAQTWAKKAEPAANDVSPPDPDEAPLGESRRQRLLSMLSRRPLIVLIAAASVLAVIAGVVTVIDRTRSKAETSMPQNQPLLLSRACPAALSLGEHDECVRELQRLLKGLGGTLTVDANFGPGTLRHVVAFQVLAGMPPNGLVDQPTKQALYAGGVKMTRWPQQKIEERIRQVFPEEPARAVGIAKCMSFLDQYYSLPNVNGTRNWGVFQISDRRLEEMGGTPLKAFDPEWNIQAARRLWSQNRDFSHWENCDQPYRSPSPSPAKS
jgi:transcriptional regulator with XRE-family HTH domain